MNEPTIQAIVEEVLKRLETKPESKIPIAVSARHCHLSTEHIAYLFGKGYELTEKFALSQPGQFAAKEQVMIVGPKGSIERVRILGPPRKLTQVEVSFSDAVRLGLRPPVRQSGDLQGAAPITIVGPKGSIFIKEGLIIAQSHIHMQPDDALRFNVADGDYVSVQVETIRPVTFEKVLIRVSERYKLEMHIDTDEANAGAISSAVFGELKGKTKASHSQERKVEAKHHQAHFFEGRLLTQREIMEANEKVINIKRSTIVTPLAKDTARDLGKVIRMIE